MPRLLLRPPSCRPSSRPSDIVGFIPCCRVWLLMACRSQRACPATDSTTLCCHISHHHNLFVVIRPPPHPRTFHSDLGRGGRNRISVRFISKNMRPISHSMLIRNCAVRRDHARRLLLTVAQHMNHVRYFATFCIVSGTYTTIGLVIAWCKRLCQCNVARSRSLSFGLTSISRRSQPWLRN